MLAASFLENVLNRGLPRSPRAQQLCAELAGRRVAVAVAGSPRCVLIESTGLSLKLSSVSPDVQADAVVRGGPFSLVALSGETPEAVLQRGDVRIAVVEDLRRQMARDGPKVDSRENKEHAERRHRATRHA